MTAAWRFGDAALPVIAGLTIAALAWMLLASQAPASGKTTASGTCYTVHLLDYGKDWKQYKQIVGPCP